MKEGRMIKYPCEDCSLQGIDFVIFGFDYCKADCHAYKKWFEMKMEEEKSPAKP